MSTMADEMKDIKYEVFEAQSEIIRLQSEVIADLFRLLAIHAELDEADTQAAVEKINRAAMLRAEHEL